MKFSLLWNSCPSVIPLAEFVFSTHKSQGQCHYEIIEKTSDTSIILV